MPLNADIGPVTLRAAWPMSEREGTAIDATACEHTAGRVAGTRRDRPRLYASAGRQVQELSVTTKWEGVVKTSRKSMLVALLATAIVACGDDSTGPDERPGIERGSLKFDYNGAVVGTFNADGKAPAGSGNVTESYAAAHRDTTQREMGVAAIELTNGSRANQVVLLMEGAAPGRYSFDADCETNCATMYLYFDIPVAGSPDAGTRIFIATGGEVIVTEASSHVLKGTFHGRATEFSGEGDDLQFGNGSFNAPVLVTAVLPTVIATTR